MRIICWLDVKAGSSLMCVLCWRSGSFSASLPFPSPSDSYPDGFPKVCQTIPHLCACKWPFVHNLLLDFSSDCNAKKMLLMPCCVNVALPAHPVGHRMKHRCKFPVLIVLAPSHFYPLLRGQKASWRMLLRAVLYCLTRT